MAMAASMALLPLHTQLPSSPPVLYSHSNAIRKGGTLSDRALRLRLRLNPITGGEGRIRRGGLVVVASGNAVGAPFWDSLKPEKPAAAPLLSDVLWPAAGAFAAMAMLGKIDQILAPKGLSMTIAPLGAVCAVLFTAPSSPGARKYNIFMAQVGCAAIGVLTFTIFGSGWLARATALAASIAFMIYTRSTHPPARDCVLPEGERQILTPSTLRLDQSSPQVFKSRASRSQETPALLDSPIVIHKS
ncbi:uncharacterized protein LOC116215005 isoform X1 [Punica granatum]|uniref:Uncharacterized protein LOC116215005 isoform X1 n=1 Tax=Punica granatum TaxID=22663 RepID=A0A6P8EI90_PUNGR|nr:uncharacterized protein LOC116215005 isoform X1 [Punica granatum]